MLLQKLLWPRVGICTEDRLYYRMKAPSFRDEGDILRIEQGERVCFDTYFNSVSADKWRRYTAAQNFSLRLKLSGKLRVVLCSRHFINSQSVRAVLAILLTLAAGLLFWGRRPFRGLEAADIAAATVLVGPPDVTLEKRIVSKAGEGDAHR